MQAIKTKYSGPTNFKGSKITASCGAGKAHLSYDYSLNIDENHRAACKALLHKLNWNTEHYSEMVGGQHGDAWYWVFNGGSSLSTKGG
jgi:hypothetical protein